MGATNRGARVVTWLMWSVLCGVTVLGVGCDPEPAPTSGKEVVWMVEALVPPDSATHIESAPVLSITFSDPLSLTDAASFRLNPQAPGKLELDEQGKTLRYTLDGTLARSTTYRATLVSGSVARLSDGATYDEDVSWSFTTSEYASDALRGSYQSEDGSKKVTAEITETLGDVRTYEMTTTAALRDNDPGDGRVTVTEQAGQPVVRSGDVMFDALFSLSIQEARENSVSSISDGAFNNGQGVPCECFETGAKWNYVWTRDTAYAVDLGLAMLDPERARASLEFKLSAKKGQGPETAQIVQDTGSGGSWPVSSDRVVWSVGAEALLHQLAGAEREGFAMRAFIAMQNTAEQDRTTIFDANDGLYRGEQSFLDWREQSYPSWTAQDTVHLAMSKTLSTNVGHLRMLDLLERLATELGDASLAMRYGAWAEALRTSIDAEFWIEESGLYSSIKLNDLAPQALRKYDLLGESLAVLSDVATPERAQRVVASYPHVPMGPAVLWPQQPQIPIYHNRGIWPFVTAYGLMAAQQTGNAEVFALDLNSLIRGAAFNLSNMENFEFTTQEPYYDDGAYSGPVVNSRRQLWSVAGYFGAIVRGVFGVNMSWDGVAISPFVTSAMHAEFFEGESRISLQGLDWRGHRIDVHVTLPSEVASSPGAYEIMALRKDGEQVDVGRRWQDSELAEVTTFEVELAGQVIANDARVTLVDEFEDYTRLWAPREPEAPEVTLVNGFLHVEVRSAPGGEQGAVYDVMRDGVRVATGVDPGTWRDEQSADHASTTHCYSIEARFTSSGHASHPSRPICYWGEQGERRIKTFGVENMASGGGGQWSMMHDRAHYQDWGDADHELVLQAWRPERSGEHLFQLVYGNGSGGFNTGITASTKFMVFEDAWSGEELGRKMVVMPQLSEWSRWGESSFVSMAVQADRVYRIRIEDGINMSYFAHFVPYTGGSGGGDQTFNRANIAQLKVLPLAGVVFGGDVAVRFDGNDDLGKLSDAQQVDPGAPLEPWSRWGLDWDERYLYITLVSPAFRSDFKAAMIYIEGVSTQQPTPLSSSQGISYSDQIPQLPFDATTMITWRRAGAGVGDQEPWSGVYSRQDDSWQRVWGMTPNEHVWVSMDEHTMSMRVPRALLGPERVLRLVGHVVNEVVDEEWKELLPAAHTPWMGEGGAFIELDLDGLHGRDNWVIKSD